MNKKQFLVVAMMISLIFSPVAVQASLTWDQYLDVAYKVTWWEDAEISEWVKQTERQLGQNLRDYVNTWTTHIKSASETATTVRTDDPTRTSYPYQQYKRLAVAELLLYLQSHEPERLNEAVRIIDRIGEDQQKPDVSFWRHYIHAHQYMAADNHTDKNVEFIHAVFSLWTDVILKLEKAQIQSGATETDGTSGNLYEDLPYLYENAVNLIIDRAIIQNQMKDLETLGSIIWAAEPRLTLKDGYAQQVKLINQRIQGPKSDVFRLNYTIAYLEAEKYRYQAQGLLDKEGPTANAEEAFMQSLKYYELAYQSARTRQGQMAAISDHLDLVSFALARIPSRERLKKDQRLLTVAGHEGAAIGRLGIQLFSELAKQERPVQSTGVDASAAKSNSTNTYWKQQGFSDRQTYIYAMHALWRSIMELDLWTANYYLKEIRSADMKDFYREAPPGQAALVQYLDFFEQHVGKGYIEVVPDNAYFNAAEAASTLFDIYYHIAPYSSNSNLYDQAFGRLLQSAELFPFSLKTTEKLAQFMYDEGLLDRYGKVEPLSRHIDTSLAIHGWIAEKPDPDTEALLRATPHIITNALPIYVYQKRKSGFTETIRADINELNDEMKAYGINVRIPFQQNLDSVNTQLHQAVSALDAKEVKEKIPDAWRLVEKIKKIQLKIENATSISTLMASYPSYMKASSALKETLLRNIDHPFHTLLRKFYQERNPNRLNYILFIKRQEPESDEQQKNEKGRTSRQNDSVMKQSPAEEEKPNDEMEKLLENLVIGNIDMKDYLVNRWLLKGGCC